ncbi:hypothetical protein ACQ4PT_011260 [Festuca glaucescens]
MAPSFRFFWAWCLPLMLTMVEAEEQAEGCSAATRCGNLTISYPFWLLDMETGRSCGSPDFEAACVNNTPILQSAVPVAYGIAIIDIVYEERRLHVVDQGKLNILQASDSCPAWTMNTSIKLGLPFTIDADTMNLVFYNCTSAAAALRDSALVEMRCGNKNNIFVRGGVPYDETGDYAGYAIEGCNATVVPVLGMSGEAKASDYQQLISDGFLMKWQQPPGSGKVTHQIIVLSNKLILRRASSMGNFYKAPAPPSQVANSKSCAAMAPSFWFFGAWWLPLMLTIVAGEEQAEGCSAATRCGNLTISYPFWTLDMETGTSCGSSAFEAACLNNTPILRSSVPVAYGIAIIDIDYEEHSLHVVDQGKLNILQASDSCPAWTMNTSIKLGLPFTIDADSMNLVFYNCTSATAARRDSALVEMRCGNKNNIFVRGGVPYDETGDYAGYAIEGCNATTVPVLGMSGEAKASDYKQLISDGFLMKWQQPPGSGSKRTGKKIILIVLTSASVALLIPCIYVLIWHRKGKRLWFLLCKKTSSSTERNYEAMIVSYGSLAPKRYTYSEVMKLTSSRSDQLGKGGYGVVFKGRLDDGRLVAVKFLHEFKGNGDDFVNEVMSIGRTSHVNIVNLFGFCLEGSKRALIYEYMPNGSLDKYIYSENPKEILGWERLYAIAIGIARGLEYLHHSCNTRIVHFDIKPQNILLDKDFSPKIADFGLAKLSHAKESNLSMTGARGTIGYIAPEVHSRAFGVVSTKSDVYSYGMMLLEMVGGRKNVNSMAEKSSEQYFPDWIYDHFAQDDRLQACDVTSETEERARKMTFIGLWCVQTLPIYRPTIAKVLEMFEKSLDEMKMPPKQNFSEPV